MSVLSRDLSVLFIIHRLFHPKTCRFVWKTAERWTFSWCGFLRLIWVSEFVHAALAYRTNRVQQLLQVVWVESLKPVFFVVTIVHTVNVSHDARFLILVTDYFVIVLFTKAIDHWIFTASAWSLNDKYFQFWLLGAESYEFFLLFLVDAVRL